MIYFNICNKKNLILKYLEYLYILWKKIKIVKKDIYKLKANRENNCLMMEKNEKK